MELGEAAYSSGVSVADFWLCCFLKFWTVGWENLEEMRSYDPPWRHCLQHRPPLFLPPFKLRRHRRVWQTHTVQQCEGAAWLAANHILSGMGARAPAGWAVLVTAGCFLIQELHSHWVRWLSWEGGPGDWLGLCNLPLLTAGQSETWKTQNANMELAHY